mgnify:CR=1 FL=1
MDAELLAAANAGTADDVEGVITASLRGPITAPCVAQLSAVTLPATIDSSSAESAAESGAGVGPQVPAGALAAAEAWMAQNEGKIGRRGVELTRERCTCGSQR